MQQDRYEESLQTVRQADAIRSTRRTVQMIAHLLSLAGRDDEAEATLVEADGRLQIASIAGQLAGIAYERRDWEAVADWLSRFEQLSPLAERAFADESLLLRSEVARRLGNDERAIELAAASRTASGRRIAKSLADPARRDRLDVILDVPFVRQHELTCGPATLAAISRYFDQPAEHLEVAEEICYAGTTTHAERNWAKQQGYVTAEFTVTPEATETLIAAGLPFTLATRGADSGHLQAVVGYDGRTESVVIRDPTYKTRGSADLKELLKHQAAHGPRGMVMVPPQWRGREDWDRWLADQSLPDAGLHDLLHEFDGALIGHRRDEAVQKLAEMRDVDPEHRLTLTAARQLAGYDQNLVEMERVIDRLLSQFPEDSGLRLTQVAVLEQLGRPTRRLEKLREWTGPRDTHPLLTLRLGQALAEDGRTGQRAAEVIGEAIRRGPRIAEAYAALADLWQSRGRRIESMRPRRFAACLEDTDEGNALAYFEAALATGQTDVVLTWLQERFERFGGRSCQPAITLVEALRRLRRTDRVMEVLDRQTERRPDDPLWKLYLARALMDLSGENWPRCDDLIQQTAGAAPPRAWTGTAAHLAMLRGDLAGARELWRALLGIDPLAVGTLGEIADLTHQIDGADAVVDHWRAAVQRFPHHRPIRTRYAAALSGRSIDEVRPVFESMLADEPDDAWAHRQWADHLLQAGRLDEAEMATDRASQLDDVHPFIGYLKASILFRRGDADAAREALHRQIDHDINDEASVGLLLQLCKDAAQTRLELDWLLPRLRAGTLTGDVMVLYVDAALSVVPAEELLAEVQSATAARPELWSMHHALIRLLRRLDRLDEAAVAADAAVQRFPIDPAALYARLQVAQAAGDRDTQQDLLDRLRVLRPGNPAVLQAMANLAAQHGRLDEAIELLTELVAASPTDPINRGHLAEQLTEDDRLEEAIEHLITAVTMEPEYDFGWGRIAQIAERLDEPERYETVAREVVERRPHQPNAWIQLAMALAQKGTAGDFEEALSHLQTAESIDPFRVDVHQIRSRVLLACGRVEEAVAALQPAVYPAGPPAELQLSLAGLRWSMGHHAEAMRIAHEVATADVRNTQAWRLVRRYAGEMGDNDKLAESIERLIENDPHDPEVLDAAASAYVFLEQEDRAIELYQRAVAIDPGFAGSRCEAFDLLAGKDRWDEAIAMVTGLPRQDDHPAVIARRIMATEHTGADNDRPDRLRAGMEELLAKEPLHDWSLQQTEEVFERQGLAKELAARLRDEFDKTLGRAEQMDIDAAEDGDASGDRLDREAIEQFDRTLAILADRWIATQLKPSGAVVSGRRRIAERLRRWTDAGPRQRALSHALLPAYVERLADQFSPKLMAEFILENESWLRADINHWGTLCYTMIRHRRSFSKRVMRRWVDGYEARRPFDPWIADNVHELLRWLGRPAEAKQLVLDALTQPPDGGRSSLSLWASMDTYDPSNPAAAIEHFMRADPPERLSSVNRLLGSWIEAVLAVHQSDDRAATAREMLKQISLTPEVRALVAADPSLWDCYLMTRRRIADLVGTRGVRLSVQVERVRMLWARGQWEGQPVR